MNVHVILPSPRNDTNIMETKPLRSRWQLCCRMKTKTKTTMIMRMRLWMKMMLVATQMI